MQDPSEISFSVVVPVYNRGGTILPTLESVHSQTHKHFTCLIVDDGSIDGEQLRAVVEGMEDPRFRYLWQENGGGGAARTTGILASEGDFVAFLDSDDTFLPNKLAVVAGAISAQPDIDVWAHLASMERGEGVSIIRPTRLPRDGESVADMMFRHREFMQTSTLVVRTALAKEVRFDPRLRKAQDVDFMVRSERSGARVQCIPQVLSIWNDLPAENRVGSPRRPDNVMKWYSEQKPYFNRRTRYAFESTYLAYEIAQKTPLLAATYIGRAFLTGAVGAKLSLATVLRSFLPQQHYRKIIDYILERRR
jgi:glycosyltransferase involved in cell wall biosynthesis